MNNKKLIDIDSLYDFHDIMRIFKCQERKARALMRSSNFPTIRIGRETRVVPSQLSDWINQNYNKHIKIDG